METDGVDLGMLVWREGVDVELSVMGNGLFPCVRILEEVERQRGFFMSMWVWKTGDQNWDMRIGFADKSK